MRINPSKILFPHLPPDLRRRAWAQLVIIGRTNLLVGGSLAAVLVYFDRSAFVAHGF